MQNISIDVEVDYTDCLRLLRNLRKNLSLYPPGHIRAVLDIVRLQDTSPDRGGYAMSRKFVLSTASALNGGSHHELEHVYDLFDNGLYENNTSWSSLNSGIYITYYQGDFEDCRRSASYISSPLRGFPSYYGHCNADEDQAEVAKLLMNNPTVEAQRWVQTDAVLARKIEQVKTYMRRRSNGLMDDQYWRDLEAGKVNEAYWWERAKALRN